MQFSEATNQFHQWLQQRISEALKSLLETKHLYQSTTIVTADLISALGPKITTASAALFDGQAANITKRRWVPDDKAPNIEQLLVPARAKDDVVSFPVPDVKLFCLTCDRIEPYTAVSALDFSARGNSTPKRLPKETTQTFSLSLLCQSCKSVPEVFLVHRVGVRLTLSGRAPIEHVAVPKVIPKVVSSYYSGGIVAHQSGQTLAGLFLLRTLIEQWVRSSGAKGERADEALEAYVATLPQDFKDRFPTLRSTYSEISQALHSANATGELFKRSVDSIVEHFEARRLFKLA